MKIEQIIIDAVTLTEKTKIPVLFLSNPGLGKTTILKNYSQERNWHLETLIGSRFSPEEISGYQVNNGGDHLTHMNPEWFNRIMQKEKEGVTSLLFIDELSTCSEAVQGALLSLIFDRTIGNGKFLPESCIIVSAANYFQNLPSYMNIMTPTLNRFILINLNENYKAMDLLNEFIDDVKPQKLKKYMAPAVLPENFIQCFNHNYKELWKEIFFKYSDQEAAVGYLDISNMNIDGLYSRSDRYIYNCISGRTISYLQKVLIAYISLGIKNSELLEKIIDGLVGAGTCSFKDARQGHNFRKTIHKMIEQIISKTGEEVPEYIPLTHDISKDVQAYLINRENTGFYNDRNVEQLVQIMDDMHKTFTIKNITSSLNDKNQIADFTSKMESLIELQQVISQYPDSSNLTYEFTKTTMDFYGLYCEIMNIKPDFAKTFGCTNSLFEQVVFIQKKSPYGVNSYSRAVLRKGRPTEMPALYYMSKDESFLDAKFGKIIHDSDNISVIHYDGGIVKTPSSEFLKQMKNKFKDQVA